MEDFLRAVLRKFEVTKASIERTLQVASAFTRRGGSGNHLAMAILDVFSDALNSKIRMSATTLRAITEVWDGLPLS